MAKTKEKITDLKDARHDMGTPSGQGWALKPTQETIEDILRKLGSKPQIALVVLGGRKAHGYNFYTAGENGSDPVMTQCLPHGRDDGEVYNISINRIQDREFVASYIINGSLDFADADLRVNEKYWDALAKIVKLSSDEISE